MVYINLGKGLKHWTVNSTIAYSSISCQRLVNSTREIQKVKKKWMSNWLWKGVGVEWNKLYNFTNHMFKKQRYDVLMCNLHVQNKINHNQNCLRSSFYLCLWLQQVAATPGGVSPLLALHWFPQRRRRWGQNQPTNQMFFFQVNHPCLTNDTWRLMDNRNTFCSDF